MSFSPKPIRTEADYEAALAELDRLWKKYPAPGTPAFEKLDLLGLLIETYETERSPIEAPDAVAALAFYMEQHDLKSKDLGDLIGSRARASDVLNRKRPLSLAQIRTIHQTWRISAEALISA